MSQPDSRLLLLNQQSIEKLTIPYDQVLNIVERAFLSLDDPNSLNPLKVIMEPADEHSIAYSMAGRDAASETVGFKAVYEFDSDRQRNNYQFYSFIFIVDDRTGRPLALMDVQLLGPLRTSATSALIAKTAATKNAQTALVVGTGIQAQIALPMLATAMPRLKTLMIHGSYQGGIQHARDNLKKIHPTRELVVSENLQQSAGEADIILALTGRSSRESISYDWLKPGALVILVGYGVDTDVLHKADYLIATDEAQMQVTCTDMRDEHGRVPPVNAELSNIIKAEQPARNNDSQIVFAYNSGMIITDVALGRMIAELAESSGVGERVAFW